MVARKIFHVFVGFTAGNTAFFFVYIAGEFLYSLFRGDVDHSVGPLFGDLPRFALITSVALPLALAVVIWKWKGRQYVATGFLVSALSSLVFWLVFGRPTLFF
jgi:hypothetical protein